MITISRPSTASSPRGSRHLGCAVFVLLSGAFSVVSARAGDDFAASVAPILLNRCLECHNGADRAGGLDLSTDRGMREGGETGPAIEPGNPEESFLLQRVTDGEMPPPKQGKSLSLPEEERDRLRRWIEEGASWPEGRVLDLFASTTNRRAGLDWWSLQPIEKVAAPEIEHREWVGNEVDTFIARRLEEKGWSPAPAADRRVLIRRLHHDLLGLPPSHEEIESFAADDSPDSYERLVERLLASPHFGERWARHWLDVARYAETCGYERDQEKPNVWKYRDWVIRSFNDDMVFSKFVEEQLAGDEVVERDESTLVATGFLRLGTWNDEPNDPEEYKYERLEDMVHATSTAFLALTVKCARCHDHKFDPIRQTDYYRVAGAFWAGYIEPGPREQQGGPDPRTLGSDALAWTDRGPEPPPLRLLLKGDPTRPGPIVEPGQLSLIPALDRPITPPPGGSTTSLRRLQLARWISDPSNPLPARVWVNRLWGHLFGNGLVRSPDNFGFTGEKPTHPELLDWLAARFAEEGWSTKSILRLLVTSRTYRQASIHPRSDEYSREDAGNRLWWRADRRRRDAEALRDGLLAASEQLDRARMGGPSVRPVIAEDALEGLSMKSNAWKASPAELQRGRSVYLHSKRGLLPPLLTAFDFMDTTLPCGQRDVTLVPPQALALMNNEFVHEQGEEAARRAMERATARPERIRGLWRKILGRDPSAEEMALSEDHLLRQEAHFAAVESVERAPLPTGLVMHLRAEVGVTTDAQGRVTSWADQSGRGHDAVQDRPDACPRLSPGTGSVAAVRFDGSDDFLAIVGQVISRPDFSIFAVVNDRGRGEHRTLLSNWNGAAGNSTSSLFLGTTGEARVRLSDDFASSNDLEDPSSAFVLAAVSGGSGVRIHQGTRLLAERSTPLAPRDLSTRFVIGQQGNIQGEWWSGDLQELLIFDRALGESETRKFVRDLMNHHDMTDREEVDPEFLALASLCHVLLNSNEFLYVD